MSERQAGQTIRHTTHPASWGWINITRKVTKFFFDYKSVLRYETSIVNEVLLRMELNNGMYIPPNL